MRKQALEIYPEGLCIGLATPRARTLTYVNATQSRDLPTIREKKLITTQTRRVTFLEMQILFSLGTKGENIPLLTAMV